jgi:peptidoglycan/LPS O-acetylase OafA/YrhL
MVPLQLGVPGGPELLIVGVLLLILPFVLAYWVYTDAQKRGNDNTALWALAVGALTFLTFFGGILALVVYIWDRD